MQATVQEQYVEFGIAGERYALQIHDIHEIIKLQDITQIPNVMPYVKGVINLRGKIVSIISLRGLFRLMETEADKATRIIVVRHREETVGIIVDRVNKVATFTDIQPPPDRVAGIDGSFFTGIGIMDSGLVGILKLDEVLIQDMKPFAAEQL
jgi:purine-binding chemotaxis protein CheW